MRWADGIEYTSAVDKSRKGKAYHKINSFEAHAITNVPTKINKGMKNGLAEMEEVRDRICIYKWTWRATEDTRKADEFAPHESTVSAKMNGDNPLESELGKKRSEEDETERDFTQVVSRARKKRYLKLEERT